MANQINEPVRLPRLLERLDPTVEIARIHPLSLTITENAEPLSTGSMRVAVDEVTVEPGMFVRVYDVYRSLGIYRISQVTRQYKQGQPVYDCTLEHAISTLSQDIVFGDLTYEDGQTAYTIIKALLNKQTRKYWQLDESTDESAIEYLQSQTVDMEFSDCDLLDALLDFMAFLPRNLYLAFNFGTFPWKLVPRRVPVNYADAEIRLTHNAAGVKVTRDYSTLCTRIYPRGADSIGIKDVAGKDYIDADGSVTDDTQSVYGVISQVWEDSTATSATTLYNRAVKQLGRVCWPGVSVTADVYTLTHLTGDTFDRFNVGRLCRLTLPDEGESLIYQVQSLSHPDLVNDPAKATVTMGSFEKRRLSRTQAEESSGGGGGGGGGGTLLKYTQTTIVNCTTTGDSTVSWYYTVSSKFVTVSSAVVMIANNSGYPLTVWQNPESTTLITSNSGWNSITVTSQASAGAKLTWYGMIEDSGSHSFQTKLVVTGYIQKE